MTLGAGPATIEHIEIARPVPFWRVPAHGECSLDQLDDQMAALGLAAGTAFEQRPFIQVRLARAGLGAGFRAEIDAIAEKYPVRLVDVRLTALPEGAALAASEGPIVRLAELEPEELFVKAFERSQGTPPGQLHLDVFHQAQAEA